MISNQANLEIILLEGYYIKINIWIVSLFRFKIKATLQTFLLWSEQYFRHGWRGEKRTSIVSADGGPFVNSAPDKHTLQCHKEDALTSGQKVGDLTSSEREAVFPITLPGKLI